MTSEDVACWMVIVIFFGIPGMLIGWAYFKRYRSNKKNIFDNSNQKLIEHAHSYGLPWYDDEGIVWPTPKWDQELEEKKKCRSYKRGFYCERELGHPHEYHRYGEYAWHDDPKPPEFCMIPNIKSGSVCARPKGHSGLHLDLAHRISWENEFSKVTYDKDVNGAPLHPEHGARDNGTTIVHHNNCGCQNCIGDEQISVTYSRDCGHGCAHYETDHFESGQWKTTYHFECGKKMWVPV